MVNTSSTSGSVTRHSHSADESFAIDEPLQWFLLSPVLFLLSPMSDYDGVDALFLPCRYLSDRGNLLPERSGTTSEQCLASCFSPGLSVLRPDHNAKLHTVLTFPERSLTVCSHLLYHILSCTWVRLRCRQIPSSHVKRKKVVSNLPTVAVKQWAKCPQMPHWKHLEMLLLCTKTLLLTEAKYYSLFRVQGLLLCAEG